MGHLGLYKGFTFDLFCINYEFPSFLAKTTNKENFIQNQDLL